MDVHIIVTLRSQKILNMKHTVHPFKFAGINVRVLVPATYSRELKFAIQL